MDIIKALSEELKLSVERVEAVIALLDDGNTIPFIARYRKEKTGAMDDVTLRNFAERLEYLRGLEKRREEVRLAIEEQGKMTEEIAAALGLRQNTVTVKLSRTREKLRTYLQKEGHIDE